MATNKTNNTAPLGPPICQIKAKTVSLDKFMAQKHTIN